MSTATALNEPPPLPEAAQDPPPWRTDPDFWKTREVLRGVVLMSPRPAPPHAMVASALGASLNLPFQQGRGGPGGWWILDEPEVHLGAEELSPDLVGWRRERLPALPQEAYFAVPPDWVCEILSPRTEDYDRTEKLEIYAEYGVPYVWLVNPILRLVEVYHLGDGSYTLRKTQRGKRVVKLEPFEVLPIDLSLIWPE